MFRDQRIMEQKGISKIAADSAPISVSNRTKEKCFKGVDDKTSEQLEEVLGKISSNIVVEQDMEKKAASFNNGLEMFSGVRRMISDKLGVSEGVAHDMTSGVITKADMIAKEYGGDAVEIASGIIDEMHGKVIENPGMLNSKVDLHPFTTSSGPIQEQVKQRLIREMGLSHQDAERYKTLILKQAQDLTVSLRPHKRDDIAMAIVDVVAESNDLTSIYGFKDSPMLVNSVKMELGG